uniref:TRAP transporter, 4TM/12TM fusion protein n=1 Tax=Candidatus Kentrum sp. MB TaxID=2138164 RepID=A0A450XKD2_9GAMM|nr:MAG: TRAP transporter, 4TM/12TM fusion protein [Candidatus Kentron sp. MB]VFK33867.1 MAG: TRAP transporter, 4TM/12TM fusion protein [Candidatus Kentron sp. MB]VFK76472.1 MAG: TRAP transporter, 4TM/12TM fusion protein [Candidatus Kentron sp. MB]
MYEKLHKIEKVVFDVLAVGLVLFYSYSAIFQPAATQYHRGIYVVITYILVFLLYKSTTPLTRVVDYILIALSIGSIGYWMVNFEAINYRTGAETPLDMAVAMVGVLVGVELARRVVGNVFVILGGVMLLYGVYGDYAPDIISHAGDSFPALCTSIFYKSDGVFGIMANVLATYVLLFVIFGAFLEKSGAQRFFIDFPLAAVGHRIGGPGKVSVIASGLFGSISGSAIANTVSTGAFTIPMMKKAGFKPHVAGGIEPAASLGGMFMPPIMGAGGFIMAELTGIPYSQIMLVAIFPALMYFFSVYIMVHYEAKKHNIVGERSPTSAMEILKREWFYILPLVIITIFMLLGYSPAYAAILGIVACVVVGWFSKNTRAALKEFIKDTRINVNKLLPSWNNSENRLKKDTVSTVIWGIVIVGVLSSASKDFIQASRAGAENSLKIGATLGVIGIIIGVLTFSGLVLTFADIVIELADGSLFLTIFLIALASLVLGMGVPVTAAYLITAVVAVPALIHLGVNPIAAHMIVYWLSQDSNITPPVCIAAFAGATIAKANMWKTAFTSFKFAKFLYLAPFLFGYVPGFSLDGSARDIAITFALVLVGTYAYSWFLSGIWLRPLKRR